MATELAIAIKVGATVGAAIGSFTSLGKSISSLSNLTSELENEQQQLGLNISKYMGKSDLIVGDLTYKYNKLGITIDKLKAKQLSLNNVLIKREKLSDQKFTKTNQDILALTRIIPMMGEKIAAIVASGGQAGIARNDLTSFAKASDIVSTLGRIGGVAQQLGLTANAAAALSNSFISLGKSPEVAGTAINGMLTKLITADKGGAKFQAP